MKEPLVYIIISNYQGLTNQYKDRPLIQACLDNLLKKTKYSNYKIIIGDDKSTDGSVSFIKKAYPNIGITVDPYGWNSARANNNAIRSIRGRFDFVLLMNNDVIVTDSKWLSRLVSDAEKSKADIMGCKLLYPDGRIQHAGLVTRFPPYCIGRGDKDNKRYSEMRKIEGVGAGCMLIRRKTIEKIGMLNEIYNFGPDDVEYCIKANKAGLKIVYDGRVNMLHLEGSSTINAKAVDTSLTTFYYRQLGFIHFVKNNFGLWHLPYLFLYEIGYSLISVEGKDRKRGVWSIRIKNRPFNRLYSTMKAWRDYLFMGK